MAELKALPIPAPTQQAQRAVEILRVWINEDKSMHSSLLPTFYETGLWGILLVDLVHQIAEAYEKETGLNKDETVASIRAVFTSAFEGRSQTLAGAKGAAQGKPKK